MKKLSLLVLALSVFLSACNNKCIEDLGIQSSKELSLNPFDQIDVQGAMKLILVQDSSYKATIQTDSNLLAYIKADVSSSKLKLKVDREYCGNDSVVVRVGIGELKSITAAGAVQVITESKLILNDLSISMSGSSRLWLDLSAGKLSTTTDGIADIYLSGQAGSHQLKTKGTVAVDAFNFVAGLYNIDIEGVGKANINVLNELKVETSGSSEIYYKGNPKKVDEKKSGATKLEKVN